MENEDEVKRLKAELAKLTGQDREQVATAAYKEALTELVAIEEAIQAEQKAFQDKLQADYGDRLNAAQEKHGEALRALQLVLAGKDKQ